MFSEHNSYSDYFPEGKAENKTKTIRENSTLGSEMGNSECYTPWKILWEEEWFQIMGCRGDPPVPGCAGEIWNEVPHPRKHALGRRGGRSKAETFPRHSMGPPGRPSFSEPCGGDLDQESPPGGLYAPPPGRFPQPRAFALSWARTVTITLARSRQVMSYLPFPIKDLQGEKKNWINQCTRGSEDMYWLRTFTMLGRVHLWPSGTIATSTDQAFYRQVTSNGNSHQCFHLVLLWGPLYSWRNPDFECPWFHWVAGYVFKLSFLWVQSLIPPGAWIVFLTVKGNPAVLPPDASGHIMEKTQGSQALLPMRDWHRILPTWPP